MLRGFMGVVEWLLEGGLMYFLASGLIIALWEIRRLRLQVETLQETRVMDHKAFIDVGHRLHDKAHRTANDLARVADAMRREREQRRRLP